MTYKEIGYLRAHREKFHPREANELSRALLGGAANMTVPKGKGTKKQGK